jgi:hypothetical protein
MAEARTVLRRTPPLFAFISAICFCILVGTYCPSSHADETAPLRVTVLLGKPYAFTRSDGSLSGIMPGWIDAIFKKARLPYQIKTGTVKRIVSELNSGHTDVSILLRSKPLLDVADCIGTTSTTRIIAVGRKGTDFKVMQDLRELANPIGVILGARYGKFLDDDDSIKKFRVNSYEQNLKMLFRNRLDAIAGVDNAIYETGNTMGYEKSSFGRPVVISERIGCLFFSKATIAKFSTEVVRLSKSTTALREDGSLANIEKQLLK